MNKIQLLRVYKRNKPEEELFCDGCGKNADALIEFCNNSYRGLCPDCFDKEVSDVMDKLK